MTVQERVARGARWLNDVRPGWRDALALETLDLADPRHCVLGQVFSDDVARSGTYDGGFTFAVKTLVTVADWLDYPEWTSDHGFNIGLEVTELKDVPGYLAALKAEWSRMIHVPRDELACGVAVS